MESKTLEISDGAWLTCRRPSNELTTFPIPCGDECCNIPKLLFSAPYVSWPGIGRELACCCCPCCTHCVSWSGIGREFACSCGLVEHSESPGLLLEKNLPAVVVLVEQ